MGDLRRIGMICFLWVALLFSIVSAQDGSITLLAVSENANGTLVGTTADLYLEVKPGQGRVFIESFPLTKIDTQISTRFAKDIACNYIDIDCSKYDFFYTIRSDSPIIGGPSAGAATSVLTASLLLGLDYDESIALTGTINSGGIIGSVGGVSEKISAANKFGITKVLIPAEEMSLNETFDEDFSVISVATLDDAMEEFTGRRKVYGKKNITISPEYQEVMTRLADELCGRAKETSSLIHTEELSAFDELLLTAENLTNKGEIAYAKGEHFAAASHCFGAGLAYRRLQLMTENRSSEELLIMAEEIEEEIDVFESHVEQKALRTITDLEAYMIVKERLIEARQNINKTFERLEEGELPHNELAYATERLTSARLWAGFFGTEGKVLELDKDVLERSCLAKIDEAQERYHYSTAYIPGTLSDTLTEINLAKKDYDEGNYALCLFKASKAKAEADLILNAVSINPDNLDNLIDLKVEVAEQVIADAIEKDMFPIVGYSYYEYAKNLKEYDKYSSLLYAEYALELSNFDVYLGKEYQQGRSLDFNLMTTLVFFIGFLTGVVFTFALIFPRKK